MTRLTPADGDTLIQVHAEQGEPDLKKLVQPFDDPEGDLYRLRIVQGKEQAYLFADFHHILFDGMSGPIFLNELNRAYAGEPLTGEAVTAADVAQQEREARKTDSFTEAEKWYDALLSDSEISTAPIHDHEGRQQKNAYLEWPLKLDGGELAALVKKLNVKTSAFFTGVFGYTLSRFAGAKEALFASIHSGRTPEISGSLGMFVKTFPVLERFDGKDSIADHLKSLNEQLITSRKNGLYSYADCCSRYHLAIPTLFAYQGEMEPAVDFLGGRRPQGRIGSRGVPRGRRLPPADFLPDGSVRPGKHGKLRPIL